MESCRKKEEEYKNNQKRRGEEVIGKGIQGCLFLCYGIYYNSGKIYDTRVWPTPIRISGSTFGVVVTRGIYYTRNSLSVFSLLECHYIVLFLLLLRS
jgi:hypothetical protein